jgi:ElaB/YqjD/DUF883 family membrane-anchored ribosome-binding protein
MSTQSQKLATDIRVLVDDAEALMKATATETGEKVIELRRRLQQTVNEVKPHIATIETAVSRQVTSTAACTDSYVRDNPWTAMGISAGMGLVIGLLVSRG